MTLQRELKKRVRRTRRKKPLVPKRKRGEARVRSIESEGEETGLAPMTTNFRGKRQRK